MNKKQKNLTNKGFSLVELIIVIAIMAVLVGVLAPQYIKYVEKSRVSADAQQVEEFTGAMTVLASDVDVTLDSTKTYTVTSDTTGKITISNDLKTILILWVLLIQQRIILTSPHLIRHRLLLFPLPMMELLRFGRLLLPDNLTHNF